MNAIQVAHPYFKITLKHKLEEHANSLSEQENG